MVICIITASVIRGDGQGRANFEIVSEAFRRGHSVTLVAREVDIDIANHPLVTHVRLKPSKLPTELLRGAMFARRARTWLERNRKTVDVVQAYGSSVLSPTDVNTSQFVHGVWIKSPFRAQRHRGIFYNAYQWMYSAFNARRERVAYGRAKVVIAVSEKIREDLKQIGVPPDRIQVILNGVDLEEFVPEKLPRERFGLPLDVPLALFAGDIRTSRKNLDTVLQAMTVIPELHLVIAGATEGSPYPQIADRLGISSRTHFLGFRRDVSQLMRATDFFVFPSRYEACTLVLMEAMASGLPVITASTAGGAEVVTPECGFVLSNPDDAACLSLVLRELCDDVPKRQRMGEAARRIVENHSWSSKAKAYVDLFESLTKSSSLSATP